MRGEHRAPGEVSHGWVSQLSTHDASVRIREPVPTDRPPGRLAAQTDLHASLELHPAVRETHLQQRVSLDTGGGIGMLKYLVRVYNAGLNGETDDPRVLCVPAVVF